jgi:putative intracellular protease/amidase
VTRRIAVFLFDGCEELDWAGPWEVLSAWALNWPEDDTEVFTIARAQEPIDCAKGLKVIPEHSWSSSPPIDVLVYPGGRGTRAHIGDEAIDEWLHDLAAGGALMTSVCTGALVYAAAGLLDGRPATTHWGSLELLSGLGKDIEIRPHEPLRRRWRGRHRCGGVGWDRHGASPRCATSLGREGRRGPTLHPVRPPTSHLTTTQAHGRSSPPTGRELAVGAVTLAVGGGLLRPLC